MKKFVNDPKDFVPEMLKGIALANPKTLKYIPEYNLIMRTDIPMANKVSIMQGSGSGHSSCEVGDLWLHVPSRANTVRACPEGLHQCARRPDGERDPRDSAAERRHRGHEAGRRCRDRSGQVPGGRDVRVRRVDQERDKRPSPVVHGERGL